jgi:polyisoprenoid-binding protein YceI
VLTVTDGGGRQVARAEATPEGDVATGELPTGHYTAIVTAAGYSPTARTALVTGSGAELGPVVLDRAGDVDLPPPGAWTIDPAHSSITVVAQHLGISSVRGRFTEFSGLVEVHEPVERSAVHAVIRTASIDTGNELRDTHLRSPDFLDVERFPTIAFTGRGVRRRGSEWVLAGELDLHGVVRAVELDLRYGGCTRDTWGGTRAAFQAGTTLRRSDFAMDYNAVVSAGIAAIGTTLQVVLDVQTVRGDALPGA